ncbi:50S ribosomal protein L24 [Candidatus Peregrinibacteria bacterium]|nr:50S ribosomal protein L24 [Candidatus Peregrinibacteria bacterium]
MKLKVNDQVMVIAGKEKGKSGKILRVDRKNNRVTVEKLNLRTKHVKKSFNGPGEKIRYEAPLSASNVMIIDPKSGKPTRIKHQKLANGKKERIASKSGNSVDNVSSSAAAKPSKKKAK